MSRLKLVFFSPVKNTSTILKQLFSTYPGVVGSIGNYEGCAFVTRGTGQFLPGEGAKPTLGVVGKVEYVEEDRVEVVVKDDGQGNRIKEVISELKKIHPYEEVAYDVYKLENF